MQKAKPIQRKLSTIILSTILISYTAYTSAAEKAEDEIPAFSVSFFRELAPSISCSEIGNAVSKAYLLKKQGKTKKDIYWDITPEDSTYIKQDFYTIMIDVGMGADEKTHKNFTQACRNNMETYQRLIDTQSQSLYDRVDGIYSTVYTQETRLYKPTFSIGNILTKRFETSRYGSSKSNVKKKFINDKSPGGLDEISNEINNLIAEEVIDLLYAQNIMNVSDKHPKNLMPSLYSVREKLAPELILKLTK